MCKIRLFLVGDSLFHFNKDASLHAILVLTIEVWGRYALNVNLNQTSEQKKKDLLWAIWAGAAGSAQFRCSITFAGDGVNDSSEVPDDGDSTYLPWRFCGLCLKLLSFVLIESKQSCVHKPLIQQLGLALYFFSQITCCVGIRGFYA